MTLSAIRTSFAHQVEEEQLVLKLFWLCYCCWESAKEV